MSPICVAVAQVSPRPGDVEANTAIHCRVIAEAASLNIHCVVFPELSLTGYEPGLAARLAFTADDRRLVPMIETVRAHGLYAVVGAPLLGVARPRIGAFILSPDGTATRYAKMHLDPSEVAFFEPGTAHRFIRIADHTIAIAICADTNVAMHVDACKRQGATIYMAGSVISERGYTHDTDALAGYARNHEMVVAMANFNVPTGPLAPIGRSAIWGPDGLIAAADETQSALVSAECASGEWSGFVHSI